MTKGTDIAFPSNQYRSETLTKREYFAAMALQGLASAGSTGMPNWDTLAQYAVTVADELIKELNKGES